MTTSVINWADPSSKASAFFTVREALWLPQWGRLATEADGLTDFIRGRVRVFAEGPMDRVRAHFGRPVVVHCWYRPPAYNALPEIGGAKHSPHMSEGHWSACDFHVEGISCDDVKRELIPLLDPWHLRMEDQGWGANWIHLDDRPPFPGQPRFFPIA